MFRSLGKSKIAFVLAILFGISLFFFKGGSRYSNFLNSDNVVAKVNGTKISTTKFNRTMQMNINKFNQMLGKQISGDEIRGFQIHSLALGALINDAIFENEFDKKEFKIDETIIAQKTKERIPNLYNNKNELDEAFLSKFLKNQNLQIEDVVQIINYETRADLVDSTLFKINYPKNFINAIKQYENQQREITYLSFPVSLIDISESSEVKSKKMDEVLKLFYEENTNNYMSEEKRSLDFVYVNKESYKDDFAPSSFDTQEYYNKNKELFFQQEQRDFIQFNFPDDEEANKFKDQIININGYTDIKLFADKNNYQYSEFANLSKADILDEISQSLFELNLNEVSNIIETPLAKHIIVLKNIISSKQFKFIEVEEEIKKTISSIELNNFFLELNEKINKEILDGTSLNDIAKLNNLKIDSLNEISKKFSDYNQAKSSFYNDLIASSFNTEKNFVSDVKNLNEDIFYFYNVNDILYSQPLDFLKIKKRIGDDWKVLKQIEIANNYYKENKLNNSFLNETKNKYNLVFKNLIIDQGTKELPNDFLRLILNSPKEENIQAIYDQKIYLAKVKNIVIKNLEMDLNDLTLDLKIKDAFGIEIMKNKKIYTNDNLLDALINQY